MGNAKTGRVQLSPGLARTSAGSAKRLADKLVRSVTYVAAIGVCLSVERDEGG